MRSGGAGTTSLHHPRGQLATGTWALQLAPGPGGSSWCSLRVAELRAGESRRFTTGDEEMLVLPLSGSCAVRCDGETVELAGRNSVFEALSDFVYLPPGATVEVRTTEGGRFALPGAPARREYQFRHVSAREVVTELRGAGSCSRQVNNLCMPGSFGADRLLVCEVLTPAGNWSSYPPHKHDEDRDGETVLEEIYYFEVAVEQGVPSPDLADAPVCGADRGQGQGIAYQRVYGTAERPLDVLAEVRSGDVVLVPHGWHGPSMAVPGYNLYYLNVMAGPGAREWSVCFDSAHDWIRGTWDGQAIDPRLPMTRVTAQEVPA